MTEPTEPTYPTPYPSHALHPTVTLYPATAAPEPAPAPQPPSRADDAGPQLPMLDRWSFVIGPSADGKRITELATATDRKITFKLTEPHEASCTLDGDDPAAAQLAELATDLHVFRRPAPGVSRELLFRGRIGSVSDSLDGTSHTVTVPALDYRAVLERRHLLTGSQQTWNGFDQAWIAFGLITQAQNKTGGDYGIYNGAEPTGVVRDRAYDLGDNIGERIQELSEVMNGFDWEIQPDPDGTLAFRAWYPQRGTDRRVIVELGGGALSLERSVDSKDYANAVRVTGTAPEGGGDEPPPHERYAPNLATAPQGRWDGVYGESITTANALAERADWRIAQQQVVRPSYTLELRPGWWRGPNHIWLGDPVRLVIMRGRLQVDTVQRVHEIAVSVDDNGDEQVSLTLGAPKPDYRRRTAEIDRRLATLERR